MKVGDKNGHLWRQIGMVGSDHDECVLCGVRLEGIGIPEPDVGWDMRCVWDIDGERVRLNHTAYEARWHARGKP